MNPVPTCLPVLLLATAVLACAAGEAVATTVSLENRVWRVRRPDLEAWIDADGALTGFRFIEHERWWLVHTPNFLKAGIGMPRMADVGGSRGAFFLLDGERVPLDEVRQDGPDAVLAQGAAVAVRYAFAPGVMRWTLRNRTERTMQFLMVLDASVTAVGDGRRQPVPTPANRLWPTTVWYQQWGGQGHFKLRIDGGDRIWAVAPLIGQDWRRGHHQVWEATLAAREERQVALTLTVLDQQESAMARAVAPDVPGRSVNPAPLLALAPEAGDLRLHAPQDWQVIQRDDRGRGRIAVAGDVRPGSDRVEVCVRGGATGLEERWQPARIDPVTRAFAAELSAPGGGWYEVAARAFAGGAVSASRSVAHVGIGEVFVTCGQSNSTNCGSDRQRTASGMVATFGGDVWRPADDPQPGAGDASTEGSPWAPFGDALHARLKVPIGVTVTGTGGAPSAHWRPGGMPFSWVAWRLNRLGPGGFRALLYHQGESDVASTNDRYFATLAEVIAASRCAAGWPFPWFVAQTSYHNPKAPSHETPRGAQQRLWSEGLALPGPDTDVLTGDHRAGIHFNAKGLQAHGRMWAEKVGDYIEGAMRRGGGAP